MEEQKFKLTEFDRKYLEYYYDEEGHYKKITLSKSYILGSKELFELKIISDNLPFNEFEFKKIICRNIFINKFIKKFKILAEENKKGFKILTEENKEVIWVNYNLSEFINNTIKIIEERINKEKPNCT
ncbi:MAG: hypothetical protein LBG87_09515 [Spirochaetaceae bacterium]|nr:hypothetical protein [Spirochaetaceae bacterium]